VLLSPSPHYWAKINNEVYSFERAQKDNFYYFEVTFASIVEEDGEFFAVPDRPLSCPTDVRLYFFSEGAASEIAQTTRCLALAV